MTKREAAEKWVSEFNAIPTNMIGRIWQSNMEEMQEVTKPRIGDRVFHYPSQEGGEIVQVHPDSNEYELRIDDEVVRSTLDDFTMEHYDGLPAWGTMWNFGSKLDEYWLEEQDGIDRLSACGFRVFEHEEFGYFFGIDGAGYDFYEQHWIPLYESRGLNWHEKDRDKDKKTEQPSILASLATNAEKSREMFGTTDPLSPERQDESR